MSQQLNQPEPGGSISWMAGNSVASNLLMIVLLVGGLFVGLNIKQEVFPSFTLDTVVVSVSAARSQSGRSGEWGYPGR